VVIEVDTVEPAVPVVASDLPGVVFEHLDAELPCWPCYRDGFDVPNPDEPGAEN
jgi:hypothetical protein